MLQEFAAQQDVMVFVAGKSSSNGKVLFESSRSVNPNSYFVSDTPEIKKSWFNGVERVGVSGATSTPKWLLEDVADCIRNF
jgi:4-hydroxy-3-methylbut-2-enyl diphosphate reductase